MIAALYVESSGAYFGLPGVDPWDEVRDARQYPGPHPIVAHPPCQRWGRFWHGSTRKPHQFKLGDDNGCFAAALASVRAHGGVIEHPCDSHAWTAFNLNRPPRGGGWIAADFEGGWTSCVYQGHYGHFAGKPTWLYVYGVRRDQLPDLRWGKVEQRLHPVALARHGYEKARRIGMMAMVGGKDKTRIRNATPPEFQQMLLALGRSCSAKANSMTTCFACAEFERDPQTGLVKAGCLECSARSIAASRAFRSGDAAKYWAVLDRVFHGDQKTGDMMVRRWAERMGVTA